MPRPDCKCGRASALLRWSLRVDVVRCSVRCCVCACARACVRVFALLMPSTCAHARAHTCMCSYTVRVLLSPLLILQSLTRHLRADPQSKNYRVRMTSHQECSSTQCPSRRLSITGFVMWFQGLPPTTAISLEYEHRERSNEQVIVFAATPPVCSDSLNYVSRHHSPVQSWKSWAGQATRDSTEASKRGGWACA